MLTQCHCDSFIQHVTEMQDFCLSFLQMHVHLHNCMHICGVYCTLMVLCMHSI